MLTSVDSAGAAARAGPRPRYSRLEIAIAPAAVRIARRWAAGQLAAAEPPPGDETVDEAVLVVSELVTNAIAATRAAGPAAWQRVWLVIARGDETVRIEVHDGSAVPLPPPGCGGPARHGNGHDNEGGRGLGVVAALAAGWGWQPGPLGKVVWCELKG